MRHLEALNGMLQVLVLQMDAGQSVPAGCLIVGSRMLNSVSDSDMDCVTSLAPLMDLVDIVNVSSKSVSIHFCLL